MSTEAPVDEETPKDEAPEASPKDEAVFKPAPKIQPTTTFRAGFARWARRVRLQLTAGRVITGLAVGLVVGGAAAGALWKTRHGSWRPWTAAAGIVGAAAGYAVARRRRWDDGQVALFLDGRLESNEAIATAVELGGEAEKRPALEVVVTHANVALDKATSKRVRPPMWKAWQAGAPLGAAAIVVFSRLPLPPPPPAPPPPPGVEKVQLADVSALDKAAQLDQLNARDDAQRERLKKLAEDARKLREKLKNGTEKREAQADLAKLKDGLMAERMKLGEGEERQGLESALGKMAEDPALKDAAKALGDHDLTELDDEMEKLANKLEKEDREKAVQKLDDAAKEAKKNGAPNVAKALEEQKKLLQERGAKGDAMKELAKDMGDALPPEAAEALKDFKDTGDPKAEQKLAEKMNEALKKMTPEQRKKLAEKLKQKAQQMPNGADGMEPPSKKKLKEMADQLDTPEGQEELEKQLQKMAESDPNGESEESQREQGLDDAEKGLGDAEQELGGGATPVPMGNAPGDKGGNKPGDANGNKGNTGPQPGKDDKGGGPGGGGGKGDHKGETAQVGGDGVKAHASTQLGKGAPMPGVVLGRTAGRAGETANVQGKGALGDVGPSEVGGVDRSDVPEEYREQVGRYFQPK